MERKPSVRISPESPSQLCIIGKETRQRNSLDSFLANKGYKVDILLPEDLKSGKIDEARTLNPHCYIIDEEIPLQQGTYNVVLLNGASERRDSAPPSSKYIASVFNEGADFVAEKSIDPVVLEAHIAAILRRPRQERKEVYKVGDITMQDGQAIKFAEDVYFTSQESNLLSTLIKDADKSVSMEKLQTSIFESGLPTDADSIRILILRLRRKIESNPNKPEQIITLREYGYKFVTQDSHTELTNVTRGGVEPPLQG